MNNLWAFLPMRSSNDLLGDPEALRTRLDEDSYLLFRGVIDHDRLARLRAQILQVLADHGWIRDGLALMQGLAYCRPVHEGMEEFAAAYDDVQRLEDFHSLSHDEALMGIMRQVVGETAFPHPLGIARLGFPEHYEVTTPPHQDYPNNQGSERLMAAWIPVGDCPRDLGALAVLRGSHRSGLLPLDWHDGPGNRQALLHQEMLEELRWVTTDFRTGDVLLFPAMTVHASLHNTSEFHMRISVDFRYQQEGETLTDIVLQPHFQRLTWDDVYAGWKSDRYQYYWRDLDYDVAPFENIPVTNADRGTELTDEDWREIIAIEARRDARHERRLARIGETSADRDDPGPDA
jgi:ectoine hydroxylase-related dioxygenase (phytanoyl-CoA dioxygenase family)